MKRGQLLRHGRHYITLHTARTKLGWSYPQALRRLLAGDLRWRLVGSHLFVHAADVQRFLDGKR